MLRMESLVLSIKGERSKSRQLSYSIRYPTNYDLVLFPSEFEIVNLFLPKLIIRDLITHRP